jgi:serine/threonine protein kinase/Tol biopolymer transport system component
MTDFTGQTFDRYYIMTPLGEGGMASVYKAYDTRLEREVAVKIIRTDMFIPSQLQKVMKRFEREAKSLARLSHPNIVSIIDYGEHDGVPYLVMEYLPGGNLKDRLTGQPLPWQEAFHLLLPVTRALQFSHGQGIVHRDVKPSNILITLSGEPMLSDFGIAKILETEGTTNLTGTGVGIGTPEYMAPEQWTGDTSPQSDLYSLGVVLYEMVTGQKPYMADTPAAILLKQANESLRRPRVFVSDLPDRVEKIVLKALAKRPEDRYQSMQEFSAAMEELLSEQGKSKQPMFSWGKRKETAPHPAGQEAPPVKQEVQPTVNAGLPAQAPPGEPPAPEIDSDKTSLAAPVAPAVDPDRTSLAAPEKALPAPGTPHPSTAIPFPKEYAPRTGSSLLGRMKIRPVWIIAAVGLVGLIGLVAVIAFAVWGVPALKTWLAPGHASSGTGINTAVSGGYTFFTSDMSGKAEVYYMDSNGNPVQYTHTKGNYESWAPAPASGGMVFFTSNQSGKAEVFYMDSKGNPVQYTHTKGNFESWSPAIGSGGMVFFTSNQSGKAEVFYMDSKGNPVQYTHTKGNFESWSPAVGSGGMVFFTSNQSGKAEVFYMDSKGNPVQYTHTKGSYESWSPAVGSGGMVFFTSNQSGKAEVFYMDSKGNPVQYTHTKENYESWSPAVGGGGVVFFTSNQSRKTEVYYMDSKGKPVQFTNTSSKYESWMPMNRRISANTRR